MRASPPSPGPPSRLLREQVRPPFGDRVALACEAVYSAMVQRGSDPVVARALSILPLSTLQECLRVLGASNFFGERGGEHFDIRPSSALTPSDLRSIVDTGRFTAESLENRADVLDSVMPFLEPVVIALSDPRRTKDTVMAAVKTAQADVVEQYKLLGDTRTLQTDAVYTDLFDRLRQIENDPERTQSRTQKTFDYFNKILCGDTARVWRRAADDQRRGAQMLESWISAREMEAECRAAFEVRYRVISEIANRERPFLTARAERARVTRNEQARRGAVLPQPDTLDWRAVVVEVDRVAAGRSADGRSAGDGAAQIDAALALIVRTFMGETSPVAFPKSPPMGATL